MDKDIAKRLLDADRGLESAEGAMCRRFLKTIVAEDVAMRVVV